MVFSSLPFLYLFLPGTMILYFIMPEKGKNPVLLFTSLLFYFCGGRGYILLIAGEILLSYMTARLLNRGSKIQSKIILILFLMLILGVLCFYKYAGFIQTNINKLLKREQFPVYRAVLPIGISFYTFQCTGYVIDVYRRVYPAEKNFIRFATFVSFFPQLIAGPIVRYDTVKEALRSRTHSLEKLSDGIRRFTIGLGKKVLLADRLFMFCTQAHSVSSPSMILSFTEGIAYLLYVYYDFSGYSDMALGLAKCFGFDIPENFQYPLISSSVQEFFRRWHISLGSWFGDYGYIPLGENRKGLFRQILNLLIVWFLTGIWHGAGWNYMIWGLSFGLIICLERVTQKGKTEKKGKFRWIKTCFTLFLSVLVFVWFRFTDLKEGLAQFDRMFTSPVWTKAGAYYLKNSLVILVVSLIGATPWPKKIMSSLLSRLNVNDGRKYKHKSVITIVLKSVFICLIMILVSAYLVDGSFSPFLYYQF